MNPHHHHHPHYHHPQNYAAHQHHQQHYHPNNNNNNSHPFHHGVPAPAPFPPVHHQQPQPQAFSRKRSMSNDSQEESTWHSFKRLRLQGSDESSYQSSVSGEDSVYNNQHHQTGIPRPCSNVVYPNHNNAMQHHQQQPGQPTASMEQEEYSKVNGFLGLLHQQRRQRMQQQHQDGATATSEWQTPAPSFPHHHPHHHHHHNNNNPQAAPQRKQQRRYAVRLHSDSKLL